MVKYNQNWCRHYTGVHNEICNKGYTYNDIGPEFGIIDRLPCLLRNKDKVPPCPDFALFTIPELQEQDKKAHEAFIWYFADLMNTQEAKDALEKP